MPTFADKINASRRDQFVGRRSELDLFQRSLAPASETLLVHIHAPAGLGKTTLLRQFERGVTPGAALWIDGSNLTPTTEGFRQALRDINRTIGPGSVLFVDEYDALAPLDGWFRDVFLPEMPESSLVVLAGRQPLNSRWASDPAWQQLAVSISLRNFSDDEQREYLSLQGVPDEHQTRVIEFTRGHPLALSLVAANLHQHQDVPFEPEAFPDVIRTLLQRFVSNVPTPAHRKALETSSLVRTTTESLLAQVVGPDQSFELFEWLRQLSFMTVGAEGVSPKDLTREAIAMDLRWRNPDQYAHLHDQTRRYYADRLGRTRGDAYQKVLSDYIYLHRDNPAVKPFFDWGFAVDAYIDKFQTDDRDALLEIVVGHEGAESGRILEHWMNSQPENIVVLRSTASGQSRIEGFLLKLQLPNEATSLDPAADQAIRYLQTHAPLRKGEVATLFRFWMDREAHHGVSPIQSQIFVEMVGHSLSHPNLAHTFIPCSNPDFWFPMFSYAALVRLPQADFPVGETTYGMYGHDWRILTPRKWLDLLSEREISVSGAEVAKPHLPDVVLLSRESFDAAVLEALRHFNHATKLVENPLLRSNVVTRALSHDAPPTARIEALREAVKASANSWKVSGRDARLFDALEFGYIHPTATQEKAAETLDISIATFRRHLQAAVQRLSDGLWELEVGS